MKKLILLFVLLANVAVGQDFYDNRKWYVPDHLAVQFAGNIGFMSAGPGYISRNQKWQGDILVGYLPKKMGGDHLFTLTGKVSYSPWRISVGQKYHIEPLSTGIFISRTFGGQFGTKWPRYYPKGYYWWATAIRPGLFVGGKIGVNSSVKHPLQVYYEVSTYDLMMVSYFQNTDFLKPSDITSLSIGVKIGF